MTIRQAQQIFFRPESQCLDLQVPWSSNTRPAEWVRSGARAHNISPWDDPARRGLAANGVIGLEEFLENLLSAPTPDNSA
jgi:hypothetical protein